MTWTKKHDEFLQASNICGCAELLTRWMLRRAKLSEASEIELDLRQFNKWVGKNRINGEYHRKTLSTAIKKLNDRSNGMFCIMKSYSPWVHKILVRPLSFLERIESAKRASTSNLDHVKPMFDGQQKKRVSDQLLQNISKLDTLFKKLGMNYSHDALHRIWRMAGKKMSEVEGAIEYMLAYHTDRMTHTYDDDPKGVTSPKGFLHECLKHSWHHSGIEEINLPLVGSISEVKSLVASLLTAREMDRGIPLTYPHLKPDNPTYQT